MKPKAELVFRENDLEGLPKRTLGVKWQVGEDYHGFYIENWNIEKPAFLWWLALLGQRIPKLWPLLRRLHRIYGYQE